MLGEDVEDQGGPVDHLDLDDILKMDQLARGELTVTHHGVRPGFEHDVPQLQGLARADVRGRVGLVAALDDAVEHHRTGGLGEGGELGERVLRLLDRARGPDTDEHHPLQTELSVLDLGDVFEFGGQARYAA